MRAVSVVLVLAGTLLSAGAAAQDGLSPADRVLAREIFKQLIEINTTDSLGNTPRAARAMAQRLRAAGFADRKSTRLNSSHSQISYAVFCLKKKKKKRFCIHGCVSPNASYHGVAEATCDAVGP